LNTADRRPDRLPQYRQGREFVFEIFHCFKQEKKKEEEEEED
jgi:hypothetical protein